jgi:hypothetical protein
VLALSACGSAGGRQDATEPAGKFPVAVSTATFPSHQAVGSTTNLRLAVKNVGQQTVPNLTLTIFVDPNADQPFSIRTKQEGAANPSRPVWILGNQYPKLFGHSESAGATSANLDTFQFGPLAPGETTDAIWRLAPVRGGTYTVNYRVSAGLNGKAQAVTVDGAPVTGKLLVRITTKPPKAGVDASGNVVVGKR